MDNFSWLIRFTQIDKSLNLLIVYVLLWPYWRVRQIGIQSYRWSYRLTVKKNEISFPNEFLRNASFSNTLERVVTKCISYASSYKISKISGNSMFLSQIVCLQQINYNNQINCFHFVLVVQSWHLKTSMVSSKFQNK